MKCKCGGIFVQPSTLGFDPEGDGVLICDNEDRDGKPCEEWIIDDETKTNS